MARQWPEEPLADAEDLAGHHGGPFSSDVLAVAGDTIRDLCGWHIAPITEETLTIRTRGVTTVTLPTLHVQDLIKVEDAMTGQPITGCHVYADGVLECVRPFPQAIRVTINHGFNSCPKSLTGVIAEQARAVSRQKVRAESIGGRSITLAVGADPLAGPLIDRYRVRARP